MKRITLCRDESIIIGEAVVKASRRVTLKVKAPRKVPISNPQRQGKPRQTDQSSV